MRALIQWKRPLARSFERAENGAEVRVLRRLQSGAGDAERPEVAVVEAVPELAAWPA